MADLINPALAAQGGLSSDKEVANAQKQMVEVFTSEQAKSAAAKDALASDIAAGKEVMLHVYHNRLPSCNYVFKDGSAAPFKDGVYRTAVATEIVELDNEVKRNHPHIYINKEAAVVSDKLVDPMAALKDKLKKEILAEQEREANKDFGSNLQPGEQRLNASNSKDMAANISNGAASLQALPPSLLAALQSTNGPGNQG